jgi:hypothetical protein
MVIKSRYVIEGLGSRLASEVKQIGKKYTLTENEIESLPSIIEFLESMER